VPDQSEAPGRNFFFPKEVADLWRIGLQRLHIAEASSAARSQLFPACTASTSGVDFHFKNGALILQAFDFRMRIDGLEGAMGTPDRCVRIELLRSDRFLQSGWQFYTAKPALCSSSLLHLIACMIRFMAKIEIEIVAVTISQ